MVGSLGSTAPSRDGGTDPFAGRVLPRGLGHGNHLDCECNIFCGGDRGSSNSPTSVRPGAPGRSTSWGRHYHRVQYAAVRRQRQDGGRLALGAGRRPGSSPIIAAQAQWV